MSICLTTRSFHDCMGQTFYVYSNVFNSIKICFDKSLGRLILTIIVFGYPHKIVLAVLKFRSLFKSVFHVIGTVPLPLLPFPATLLVLIFRPLVSTRSPSIVSSRCSGATPV